MRSATSENLYERSPIAISPDLTRAQFARPFLSSAFPAGCDRRILQEIIDGSLNDRQRRGA